MPSLYQPEEIEHGDIILFWTGWKPGGKDSKVFWAQWSAWTKHPSDGKRHHLTHYINVKLSREEEENLGGIVDAPAALKQLKLEELKEHLNEVRDGEKELS